MSMDLQSIINPGDGTGTAGGNKSIQFWNNTNTDILVQRINIAQDPKNFWELDLEDALPGGAERVSHTLNNQVRFGNNPTTGSYRMLWGNADGSNLSKMVWNASEGRWKRDSVNWPLFGDYDGTGAEHYVHPTKSWQESHGQQTVIRWVAPMDGQATVTGLIQDGSGSNAFTSGVRGFVAHLPVGKLAANRRPNPDGHTGGYLNCFDFEFNAQLGYTRSAYDGLINANIISNWHPEKVIHRASGATVPETVGNTHNSQQKSNFRDWINHSNRWNDAGNAVYPSMWKGNVDYNNHVQTRVLGPAFGMADAQVASDPLRARYIRAYPMGWNLHPSFRFGAYNNTDKWDLGANATMTSNAWWGGSGDTGHSPNNGKLFKNTGRGCYTGPFGHRRGDHWLQMDFGSVKDVTWIGTQGRAQTNHGHQYVTQFLMMSSTDGVNFRYLTENRGDAFQPAPFTKTINVTKGDFIDMVVDAGPLSSNYDTTKVGFDVNMVKPGSGPNGKLFIDTAGWIMDATTGKKSGMEMAKNTKIQIGVQATGKPDGYTPINNHGSYTYSSKLNVEYKCDKLLTSGVEFFSKLDTSKVDVVTTMPNWYDVISKATGKKITMYVPPEVLSGSTDNRWCYTVDWGWVYWEPKDYLFGETAGTWMYASNGSNEGTDKKGWIWFQLENLPFMYPNKFPHWGFTAKMTGEVLCRFVTVSSEWVGNDDPNTRINYKYKIYSTFGEDGWNLHSQPTRVSTGPATWKSDPDAIKKIPPVHSGVGLTLSNGGVDSEWYRGVNAPTNPPESTSIVAAYRTSGKQEAPLRWNSVAQIKDMPRKVSILLAGDGGSSKWIVLNKYDSYRNRINIRPVYKSDDGNHVLEYAPHGANSNHWTLLTHGKKFKYKSVAEQYSTHDRRFPSDGSFFYGRRVGGSTYKTGEWRGPSVGSGECMLYFIWSDTGLYDIPTSSRHTGGVSVGYLQLRPDIRHLETRYSSFGYRIDGVNDITDTRDSNSRLYLFHINVGAHQGSQVVIPTRQRAGILELPAPYTFAKDSDIKVKVVYPGNQNQPYQDTGWLTWSKTPVIKPHIWSTFPERNDGNQKGFMIAACKMPNNTTCYLDCGYDTKSALRLKNSNSSTNVWLGNMGPHVDNAQNKEGSTLGFMGVNVTGGNANEVGTISGQNLAAQNYTLEHYTYGDIDRTAPPYAGNYLHLSEGFAITNHLVGHPGAAAIYSAYKDDHIIEYGGNAHNGTYRVSELCCNKTASNTDDGRDCIDFKQRVLDWNGCSTGVCQKNARGGYTAESIIVRYFAGVGNGARGWVTGSQYGSRNNLQGSRDGGPTWLKFHNTHPFSDVIVQVEAGVDVASDDVAGVALGASSTQTGIILHPPSVVTPGDAAGYIASTWEPDWWWSTRFAGGVGRHGRATVDPSPMFSGVKAGYCSRSGAVSVMDGNGNVPNNTYYKAINFGYWTIQQNEQLRWDLYGAVNRYGHGGYGQYEGAAVRWIRLTVIKWPNDP